MSTRDKCCRETGSGHGAAMSAGFTPGPWFVHPEAWGAVGFRRMISSRAKPNRTNLAHVAALYSDTKGKESDANAHLIAAAPALYEALKSAKPFIEPYIHSDGSVAGALDTLKKIEAALSLARGESIGGER